MDAANNITTIDSEAVQTRTIRGSYCPPNEMHVNTGGGIGGSSGAGGELINKGSYSSPFFMSEKGSHTHALQEEPLTVSDDDDNDVENDDSGNHRSPLTSNNTSFFQQFNRSANSSKTGYRSIGGEQPIYASQVLQGFREAVWHYSSGGRVNDNSYTTNRRNDIEDFMSL